MPCGMGSGHCYNTDHCNNALPAGFLIMRIIRLKGTGGSAFHLFCTIT
jgi:hypothetical protein